MSFWDDVVTVISPPHREMLWSGMLNMLELTVWMLLLGFIWGIVLAVLRSSDQKWLGRIIWAYIEFHRNVPLVVQLFIWYFGIPQLLPESWQAAINASNSEFLLAVTALASAFGAYVCEDLRSGIRAMDSRQMEAARSLGFSYLKAMTWVVMPQALRNSAPALVNQALLFFKSTSLAMTIGVAELTYETKVIQDATYLTYATFAVASVIYLVFSFGLMALGSKLDQPAWRAKA